MYTMVLIQLDLFGNHTRIEKKVRNKPKTKKDKTCEQMDKHRRREKASV
jgi:hypothetical protein